MANVLDLFKLDGKKAVVSGGNRGIGKAVSIALAQAGADLAIVDIRIDEKIIAPELRETGCRFRLFEADVTSPEEISRLKEEIIDEFGTVDILVNNAGICLNKNAEEMSVEEWNRVIDLDLNSVFYMSREFGKLMIEKERGSIINISSMSAQIVNYPQPQCSYNAAKAGVSHLTKSLAYEWVNYNIRVNAIAPGYIGTDLTKKQLETEWGRIWQDMTPMKRVGRPDELGALAVYMASEASTYMTGSVVVIDGGYSIL